MDLLATDHLTKLAQQQKQAIDLSPEGLGMTVPPPALAGYDGIPLTQHESLVHPQLSSLSGPAFQSPDPSTAPMPPVALPVHHDLMGYHQTPHMTATDRAEYTQRLANPGADPTQLFNQWRHDAPRP